MTSCLPLVDFPATRLRRNRRDDFSRRLVRENTLTAADLIYPVFVREGRDVHEPVPSMPGVHRYSPDTVLKAAEQCMQLGIPVLALFPVIEPNLKTPDGIEATRPDGLVARTVSAIKKHFRSEEHPSDIQSLLRNSHA